LTAGEISHQGGRSIRKGNIFTLSADVDYAPRGLKDHTASETGAPAASEIKANGRTLGSFLDAAKQLDSTQSNRFNTTSESQYGSNENNPFYGETPLINKTTSKDGHILLTGIKKEKKDSKAGAPAIFSDAETNRLSKAQIRIADILKKNRFNPSDATPFMRDNARVSDGAGKTRTGVTKQGELGKYIANAEFILEEDAKNIGKELMFTATGQDGDISSAVDSDGNINFSDLANLTRLTGWKAVSTGDMRAANTLAGKKMISDVAGVNTSLLSGEGNENSVLSFGNLNSPYEQFSGPLPLGMTINALIGLGTLVAFSGLTVALVSGFRGNAINKTGEGILPSSTQPMDMIMGRHAIKNDGNTEEILRLFRIPRVEHDFDLCMITGILSFYGLEELPGLFSAEDNVVEKLFDAVTGNLALSIFDKFANIASSAGYYSIVTRAAIRDLTQIKSSISDLNFNSFAGSVVQTFKVIESIVESTTYKFLMTMVSLGDRILSSIDGHPTLTNGNVDKLKEGAASRHAKSRVLEESKVNTIGETKAGRLAWRHAASPSRFILPKSFIRAMSNVKETSANTISSGENGAKSDMMLSLPTNSMYAETSKTSGTSKATPSQDEIGPSDLGDGSPIDDDVALALDTGMNIPGRLPKGYVRWIEDRLEAEFMPFYFHDIRTNEIISFHAFLSSLSDSYAADYASTSGYGRGDDIKIYSKTTRTVGIKFCLAATNEKDMDVLYWNLNKLVSMVYPQWSRGRSLINGTAPNEEKFIQPFSQIPTASPLIRLRFGDVLTSNYSKFGLMRLFGVGESSDVFTLNLKQATETKESSERNAKVIEFNRKLSLEAALKRTDPGGTDAEQKSQLEKFGVSSIDIAGINVTGGDSQFGYVKGDRVIISATAGSGNLGYWGRNSAGKLAKQISGFDKVSPARKLHVYRQDVEVEIVARIPDSANQRPQNEINFAAHVDSVTGWSSAAGDMSSGSIEKKLADAAFNANPSKNFYRQMAYLVKIINGSTADISLGKKWPQSMKYHRVLHSMIVDLAPSYYAKKQKESIDYVREVDPNVLDDWFSSENNYIVRSFESSMGRGLAGFITSLNIDWNTSGATWEIKPGLRAPKYLEIDMQFAPIHDIPLGLDHEGMMRAVPYNVGSHSNVIGHDPLDRSKSDKMKIVAASDSQVLDTSTKGSEPSINDAINNGINKIKNSGLSRAKSFVG
jgi:hypothetical protein